MMPQKEREKIERKETETEYLGKPILGEVKEQSFERSSEEKKVRGAT